MFVEEYKVTIKLKEKFLVYPVLGVKSANKEKIEKETGAKITICIAEKTIMIDGNGSVSKAKEAETIVLNTIKQHVFQTSLSRAQAGLIRGKGIENLRRIQAECQPTGIYLKDMGDSSQRSRLTIMGKSEEEMRKAKQMVFDELEVRLKNQMNQLPGKVK